MTSKSLNRLNAIEIQRSFDKLDSTQTRSSRYVSGGITEKSDLGLEWWERTKFTPSQDDAFYAVERKFNGNLRLISALFYGTDIYWWVIGQYNNILDPFSEVVEGVILRIPPKKDVDMILQGRTGGIPSKRVIPTNKNLPIV